MMAIYARYFKKEDLDGLVPIEDVEIYDKDFARIIEESKLAFTGIRNNRIVACGGAHPSLDSEHGELWLYLSRECQSFKIETIRFLKSFISVMEDIFPFIQFDARINCDFGPAVKLVRFLGFQPTEIKGNYEIFSKRIKEWRR